MKKTIILFALCASMKLGYSQKDTVIITKTDTSFYSDLQEKYAVPDTSEKEISHNDNDQNNDGETNDKEDNNDHKGHHGSWYSKWSKHNNNHFNGHWTGIELGINSYLSPSKSFALPSSEQYMSINTNQSLNFNINIFNLTYPLVSDRLGFVSGMGIEWNNYYFNNKNSIQVDSLGNTVEKTFPVQNNVGETSLTTMFLSVPLLLEYNFPGGSHDNRFHISFGIIGSMLVSSHTKVDYEGSNQRNWSSFNLNFLRYAFTVRAGYDDITLFCRYSPETLFELNRGPELYPVSVGIAWNLF